jgi:hypothetical protein
LSDDRSLRRLRRFTTVFLAIYAPLETWLSLPGLWDPFYLVDVVGMALMVAGLVWLRRGPASRGAAILAAAFGWSGANFWRAMAERLASDYSAGRYPEGKLVNGGPLGVAIVGGVLIALCIFGMVRAIQVARGDAAMPHQ